MIGPWDIVFWSRPWVFKDKPHLYKSYGVWHCYWFGRSDAMGDSPAAAYKCAVDMGMNHKPVLWA